MASKVKYNKKVILVTGAAGFIGYHLVRRLLSKGDRMTIIGLDNYNPYYDVSLKEWRTKRLDDLSRTSTCRWIMLKGTIEDKEWLRDVFEKYAPEIVVHLAAQAGVRYSIENPDAYIASNIIGFYNIIESCRHSYDKGREGVRHLIYASSSSVYGGNTKIPFCTEDNVDHPVSLYAATKKSNELLAYCYSKLYHIPSTGLRFFTVYGPAGRPDMAYYSFTERLCRGETIDIFNHGDCQRDFTYVDDIVEGISRVMEGAPPVPVNAERFASAPHSIYNIGGGHPENLLEFVHILAEELVSVGILKETFEIDNHIRLVSMQPGDVPVTYADASDLEHDFGYKPTTDLRTGLKNFVEWYKKFRYGQM